MGQLGYDNATNFDRNKEGAYFLPAPTPVEFLADKQICQVVAGWGHSAVLSRDGRVFICGRNFQGQLGLGDPATFPQNERGHPYQATFREIEALKGLKAIQVACGGEHTTVLLATGEVYTFGSGKLGQLGHPGTGNEHYPKLVKSLKDMRPVVNVLRTLARTFEH